MNERIQEFAKHHLVRDEHTEFGWRECHKYEFDPDELEKFAELIIRECADIASMNQHQYESTGVYVLKHFGVE